jgi:hypothetical protein
VSRRAVAPLLGEGLVSRTLRVAAADAVLVKALVEAHEGVASVFGDGSGVLTIAAPASRAAELAELVAEAEALLARARRADG